MRMQLTSLTALVALACSGGIATAGEKAPLPTKVLEARSVFLVSDTGDTKAIDAAYTELKEWGRFEVVQDKSRADLILVLTTNQQFSYSYSVKTGDVNTSYPVYTKNLYLQLLDAGTGELLFGEGHLVNRTPSGTAKRLIKSLRERIEEQQKQE